MFKRLRKKFGLGGQQTSQNAESPISEENAHQPSESSVDQLKEASEQIDPSDQPVRQKQVVIIDGRRYAMDRLPDATKEAVFALHSADQVILQRRQKIKLLKLGRARLEEQLRSGLSNQPSTRQP